MAAYSLLPILKAAGSNAEMQLWRYPRPWAKEDNLPSSWNTAAGLSYQDTETLYTSFHKPLPCGPLCLPTALAAMIPPLALSSLPQMQQAQG